MVENHNMLCLSEVFARGTISPYTFLWDTEGLCCLPKGNFGAHGVQQIKGTTTSLLYKSFNVYEWSSIL
jgi:hypothetical protein